MGDFTDRRTVLRSSAAAVTGGLAGCLGLLDGDENDSDGDEPDPTDSDGTGADDTGETDDPEPTLDSWPMFQYDAQNTGHAQGSGPTDSVELDWTFKGEEKFRGGPVIADETVYVASDDETLYALDLADGSVLWSAETRRRVRKSPLVVDDRVIVCMGDGVDAYERSDGDVAWRFDTDPDQGATTPVVRDGIVVVGSGEPAVYGIGVKQGKQEWRREMDRNLSEPAGIVDDTVYIGDWTNELHVLNLHNGRPRYSTTINEVQVTGPTVANEVVYLGGDDGTLFALDADNLGEVLWTFDANKWIEGSPAVGHKRVFFTDQDGVLYSLDDETGEEQWSVDLERRTRSAIALVGDLLYIGGGWGMLKAFDAHTGRKEFALELSQWSLLSPAVVDEMIVVADNDKGLYTVREVPV